MGIHRSILVMVLFAAAAPASGLSICSKLDFSGISWPGTLPVAEQDAFALALNISGSFEGETGWANLSNDFDGQGFSLGLLNQCLGQGSLQPMMIKMWQEYSQEMSGEFSQANFSSLIRMLQQWQNAAPLIATAEDHLADYGLSPLDDPSAVRRIIGRQPHLLMNSRNQNSVNWAVSTVYNGSKFKSDWQRQLTNFSVTPGYRSIQVESALDLHDNAKALFQAFGLRELRSYLFLFDIVVQNGGFPAHMISQIQSELINNPTWDETQKLNTILAVRLTLVNQKYRADVTSRKQSIIEGTGVVHGARRNYSKEYCADITGLMP